MCPSRVLRIVIGVAAIAFAAACSSSPATPTSATGVATSGDVNDSHESLVKVGQPALLGPADGATFDRSEVVTVTFQAAQPLYVANVPVAHELLVRRASDGGEVYRVVLAASSGTVAHTLPAPPPVVEDTTYQWQVRGVVDEGRGRWSATRSLVIKAQGVGRTRTIPTSEAIAMIINLHNAERWDLGRRSTRADRVAFLWRAVAVLHYGHPVYNSAGADPTWCVKDAGAGRPPSDDVIVRCTSREAWDILASAGGDGYRFHEDYLGRLGSEQNVYPPPESSLPR
jgi:hypothetical protein